MMNLSTMHKRIIGVICFAIVAFAFMCFPVVNAEEEDKICETTPDEVKLKVSEQTLAKYGITIDQDGVASNCFNIRVKKKAEFSQSDWDNKYCPEIEKSNLKLEKVNGESKSGTLKCGQDITNVCVSNESIQNAELISGLPGVSVVIKGDKIINDNDTNTPKCYLKDLELTIESTMASSSTYYPTETECKIGGVTFKNLALHSFKCGFESDGGVASKDPNSETEPSFEEAFCFVKQHAISEGNNKTSSIADEKYSSGALNFKCDYDATKIPTPSEIEALEGDDYFLNRHYVYAENTVNLGTATYIARYAPGNTQKKETVSCDLHCEEAVAVEYGPPVTVSAGICFEYKVRVTSRVKCEANPIPKPTLNCSYCTPIPHCTHTNGDGSTTTYTQGGPNEDFDNCVQACDGGKYTTKCSNKCYKKIYGSSATAQAKINNTLPLYYATNLTGVEGEETIPELSASEIIENAYAMDPPIKIFGIYKYSSGSIVWQTASNPHANSPGYNCGDYTKNTFGEARWYSEHRGGKYHYDCAFVLDGDGFWRKDWSYTRSGGHTTNICQDSCIWLRNCGSSTYLNPGAGRADYLYNVGLYNDLVTKCNAGINCKTSTATFTITAKYNHKTGINADGSYVISQDQFDFPLGHTADEITPAEDGKSVISTANQRWTTIYVDFPSAGKGVAGCYKGDGTTTIYRTTWGFPGSWIQGKDGHVEQDVTKTNGSYEFMEHQFCAPSDSTDINAVFAIQQKARDIKKFSLTGFSYDDTLNNCNYEGKFTIKTIKTNEHIVDYIRTELGYEWEPKWNINAKTTDFGFYSWAFDIDCFFSITTLPSCPDDQCVYDEIPNQRTIPVDLQWCGGDPGGDDPYVRPVDNENMFPDSEGDGERAPGYNWTQYATVSSQNQEFQSNPVALRNRMKELGTDGIYDDDYLDYDFKLMPSDLRAIRKASLGLNEAKAKYTGWDAMSFKEDTGTGIYRYYSNFIHKEIGGENHLPNEAAIACNNMAGLSHPGVCDKLHNTIGG